MQNYPSYSIGLHLVDGRWQITIREFGVCAVCIHAKTFAEAEHVAEGVLVAALLLEDRQPATPRKRVKSAA
jgi:hypothetical protein